MEKLEYLIRPGIEADAKFICQSWRKSYKAGNMEMNYCTKQSIYKKWMMQRQLDIFKNGAVSLLAVSPSDLNHILGYVVFQPQTPPIIHYLYTKQIYRGLGLGKTLLSKVGISNKDSILCTHTTKPCYKNNRHIIYLPDPSAWIIRS